jgi:hypothetical protein
MVARKTRRPPRLNAERFPKTLVARPTTLVLGGGVSKSRGVPGWRELTRALWCDAFGEEELPGWLRDERERLERVRRLVAEHEGPEFARRLALRAPHPLADQMALELCARRLASMGDSQRFADRLRDALYSSLVPPNPDDTLSVLGAVLREQQARIERRVVRVISLNADDHIEVEANAGHHPKRDPVVWPISRESTHPRSRPGAHGRPPIPVYHLHGFLPRKHSTLVWRESADTLVFTDSDYWATVASPLSFANRVIAHALHDTTCLFIGLSMHDVNVLRWIGLRYHAIAEDKAAQSGRAVRDEEIRHRAVRTALERHFWIRPDSDDSDGLITDLMRERGVTSVRIASWGAPFGDLLRNAFSHSNGSGPPEVSSALPGKNGFSPAPKF